MAKPVYKILSHSAFAEAKRAGQFSGSPNDLGDGFIHLSTAEQLAGTLAKHFVGQPDLVLLAVNAERLGVDLKWEPSRDGELFPHLYAPLDLAAVLWSKKLTLGKDGTHILPAGVLA